MGRDIEKQPQRRAGRHGELNYVRLSVRRFGGSDPGSLTVGAQQPDEGVATQIRLARPTLHFLESGRINLATIACLSFTTPSAAAVPRTAAASPKATRPTETTEHPPAAVFVPDSGAIEHFGADDRWTATGRTQVFVTAKLVGQLEAHLQFSGDRCRSGDSLEVSFDVQRLHVIQAIGPAQRAASLGQQGRALLCILRLTFGSGNDTQKREQGNHSSATPHTWYYVLLRHLVASWSSTQFTAETPGNTGPVDGMMNRMNESVLRAVCVFCGSSTGRSQEYRSAAMMLGRELVERNIALIFGGGRVGLMGVLADAVLAGGGQAIGVIPRFMIERELAHQNLSVLHVVESMHERKARMASLADAFIAMPGGFGTFEELCEAVTWTQLGLHRKRCGLLNVHRFYAPLLALFDQAVEEGFVREQAREILVAHDDPRSLLDALSVPVESPEPRWLQSSEET